MAGFVRGDVVVLPFPFSDLRQAKRRPALNQSSSIRPNRLFTADRAIVLYKAGSVLTRKLDQVVERVIEILRG